MSNFRICSAEDPSMSWTPTGVTCGVIGVRDQSIPPQALKPPPL
jgi:hypothetical protein